MSDIRNRFLALTKTRFDSIDLPGVGPVWFRSISEDERSDFESQDDVADVKTAKRRLIHLFCCEGQDKPDPIFRDGDVEAMAEVDSMYVDRLAAAVMKHNGIGEDDLQAIVGEPSSGSESAPKS